MPKRFFSFLDEVGNDWNPVRFYCCLLSFATGTENGKIHHFELSHEQELRENSLIETLVLEIFLNLEKFLVFLGQEVKGNLPNGTPTAKEKATWL